MRVEPDSILKVHAHTLIQTILPECAILFLPAISIFDSGLSRVTWDVHYLPSTPNSWTLRCPKSRHQFAETCREFPGAVKAPQACSGSACTSPISVFASSDNVRVRLNASRRDATWLIDSDGAFSEIIATVAS
eukprot:2388552-Rhodomonas_salina.2